MRLSVLGIATAACGSDPVASTERSSEQEAATPPQAPGGAQRQAAGPAPGRASVARTPKGRSVAPPELVVKFKSDGPKAVTECAARWLSERRSFASATADGSVSLDQLFFAHAITRGRALMPGRAGLSTANARRLLSARLSAAWSNHLARSARVPVRAPVVAGGRGDLTNVYTLELPAGENPEAVARALAGDPHVEYAQVNHRAEAVLTPNDPFYASAGSWGQSYDDLWNLKRIGSAAAWDTTQGNGVVVAVVDTGLDLTHPDIAANVWQNAGEIAGNGVDDDHNGFVDDVRGWNFAANSNDASDDFGHGTHVAGTIAAVGNNAVGVIGVAPRAQILPLKGLDATGSGSVDWLAQAIVYAAQNGADVINNSWACIGGCPKNPVVEDAVALAHDLGAVVVFAAGNDARDVAGYSPQNTPDVIVVAASDPGDQPMYFTNFGRVDVTAPGGGPMSGTPGYQPFRGVLSLKSSVCSTVLCPPELVVGGSYLRQAGTSMAAPHVAGLAALVLAENPTYSPEEVRQVIRHGADDVQSSGFDATSGHGRINAARALAEPRPLTALLTAPAPGAVLSGSAPLDVRGTALGAGFASYRVEVAFGQDSGTFLPIATSSQPVSEGRLATWDFTSAPDGPLALRVVATTTDGREYADYQLATLDQVSVTAPASTRVNFRRPGDVVSVIGTVAPGGLLAYSFTVQRSDGSVVQNPNLVLAGSGQVPVRDGLLATWDTTGLPNDQYVLTLQVVASTGTPGSETLRVALDDRLHPGWPKSIPSASFATLLDHTTVADVNGDGAVDVLLGYGPSVSIYDHTGAALPGWPQSIDLGLSEYGTQSPAVGDLTGDGVPEVVASNSFNWLFVWRNDGQLLPGWPLQIGMGGTPVIEDIDGNGTKEIVAGANGQLNVVASDGSSLPGWPIPLEAGNILTTPAVGDLDGDGQQEIAVASIFPPTKLYLLSSKGVVLSGWPQAISPAGAPFASPALGDLDGDGKLDVVLGASDGTVYAFNRLGAALPGWPRTTTGTQANAPALADLDGDGRLDVVVGTATEFLSTAWRDSLFAWHGDGTLLPGWPVRVSSDFSTASYRSAFGFGAPALADLDGDGVLDVTASSDSFAQQQAPFERIASLHGYRADGSVLSGFPKLSNGLGASETNSAAVADLDNDGKLELAWIDAPVFEDPSMYLYVWDLDAPAGARAAWPQFHHDAAHTGRADSLLAVPAAPAGLTATAGNGRVTLAWNPSAGAASYSVLRSTTSGAGFRAVASGLTATSFVDTGLANGTTYFYVVRASNSAGSSGNSNQVSATPAGVPAAPAGLKATAGNAQVSLTWNASAGATTYSVLRSTRSGTGFTTVASGLTATSFVNTGLANGTTYFYVVRAKNSLGTSGNSGQVSAKPVLPVPAPPTGLTASAGNAKVTLSWNASSGATSYSVLRSKTSGTGYTTAASGLTTRTFVNTGLGNGTTYYFVVRASNASGTSGNSAQVSARPHF